MKLAFIISGAILLVIALIILFLAKPRGNMPQGQIVSMGKISKRVVKGSAIVMLAMMIFIACMADRVFGILLVILPNILFLVALSALLHVYKFKMILTARGFTYITMFGRRYDIRYSELQTIKIRELFIRLQTRRKTFYLEPASENIGAFLFAVDMNGADFDIKLPELRHVTLLRNQFEELAQAGIQIKNLYEISRICGAYGYIGFLDNKSDLLFMMSKKVKQENGECIPLSNNIVCIRNKDYQCLFKELQRISGIEFINVIDDDNIISFELNNQIYYAIAEKGDLRARLALANDAVSGEKKFRTNYMVSGALVIFATEEEAELLHKNFGTVFV